MKIIIFSSLEIGSMEKPQIIAIWNKMCGTKLLVKNLH